MLPIYTVLCENIDIEREIVLCFDSRGEALTLAQSLEKAYGFLSVVVLEGNKKYQGREIYRGKTT